MKNKPSFTKISIEILRPISVNTITANTLRQPHGRVTTDTSTYCTANFINRFDWSSVIARQNQNIDPSFENSRDRKSNTGRQSKREPYPTGLFLSLL
jgi:hypothetical protein